MSARGGESDRCSRCAEPCAGPSRGVRGPVDAQVAAAGSAISDASRGDTLTNRRRARRSRSETPG
jgi:hypothetical protein